MDRRAIGCVFLCIAVFLWMAEEIELAVIMVAMSGFGTLSNVPLPIVFAIIFGIAGLVYLVIGEVTAIRASRGNTKD